MAALDWMFAAVLLSSMLLGAWRGLVYEVLSLVTWALAFVLAQWLALDAAHYLPMSSASEPLRYGAGFVVVFVAVMLVGSLIVVLIKKLTAAVGLSPVDRVLGGFFGTARGVLLLLLATVVLHMTPMKDSVAWRESAGVTAAMDALKGLKPALPRDLDRFLPA